ncbi:efflux transporter, RND family, MFP subunit (plasmid) [Emticicia oligotrophica DSM 17448]|uniref:Efflux transporter, RND family, MFP subunit n=1 Tax=Emticicia oligotrophica (strain DSM 17448 / CIP 109782 / MTCC 6937 / GPTSA100-15) TaxID=929562 RepID=A0ABM5N7R3_EMTOG|nr:efflux RND transporter periplasmic adaptor subunit [Emticicia oligotrophica]AFK05545.1 efflux transporter, RND family, MFP subunit [Emticicia oligotrophica DSM 17448]
MKKIFILLIMVFGFYACKTENKKEIINETFVLSDKMLKMTQTATVKQEQLRNELNFYGKITADANKMIEVFPVVGGNVTKVYVELGDYVQKGQLLATIRSTEVAGFEKELDDSKNDLIVAKNNLKVAQELFEGKLNTERDVIEAKSQLDKAQSQLLRIQETYKIYNIKAGAIYEVRSPLSGFVVQKNINQDMLLRSDKSDNIFDIAEIDDVWAMANVNESDISQVKLGINAEVRTLSYNDKVFYGIVDKIYNIIDPETKAMKVRVKLTNKDYLLKPEMRATIKLSYNESAQMLAVPSASVIFDKSKSFVMIFKDRNNIETRQVEVFRQVGDTTYILSGLKEGEVVMTANQLLVYDALND